VCCTVPFLWKVWKKMFAWVLALLEYLPSISNNSLRGRCLSKNTLPKILQSTLVKNTQNRV
jgi:hypothetical protein